MSTEFLAVYGSILATLSFIFTIILAIIEFKSKKSNLKLKVSTGNIYDQFHGKSEILIMVTGSNIGAGPVTVTGVGWLTKDKNKHQIIYPYQMRLPETINERKNLTFYYPVSAFIKTKEIDLVTDFYFKDELGKTWKCKVNKKRIAEWKNFKIDGWLLDFNQKTNQWFINKIKN